MRRRAAARFVLPVLAASLLAGLSANASARAWSPRGSIVHIDAETGDATPVRYPESSRLLSATGSPNGTQAVGDTFVIVNHSWEARSGGCQASGWTVEDRTHVLFVHVSGRHVRNLAPIFMNAKALWFGAESGVTPDSEMKNWYYTEGSGQNWSQRVTSPTFSPSTYPHMTLTYDASVDIRPNAGSSSYLRTANPAAKYFGVQALLANGSWVFLEAHYAPVDGTGFADTARAVNGSGVFQASIHLDADGNQFLTLAEPTRFRFVMQTTGTLSQEDGGVPPPADPRAGGVLLDNVVLKDGITTLDSLAFEDGTTGAWTLSAENGILRPGVNELNVTRENAPITAPSLQTGYDPQTPGCVWTFVDAGDTIPRGAMSRLTSPWFKVYGGGSQFTMEYDARLGLVGDLVRWSVRGKRTSDTHPRLVSVSSFFLSGTGGSDESQSPYFEHELEPYPFSSSTTTPPAGTFVDSMQFVIDFSDQPERLEPFGVLARYPLPKLPYFSRIAFTQTGVDPDGDGVPAADDQCSSTSATGQDANGDGCVDSTATLRHVESWAQSAGAIHWVLSGSGLPTITDGSDTTAVRDAFATWQGVVGSTLQLVEDPSTSQTLASALDGVDLITFEDDYVFPPNVLAITPTTSFMRNTSFFDRPVLPGEIVDADILFNPSSSFRTATSPTGAFDIRSVATHEIGHLLGLSHSAVSRATMFPVLQPGAEAASLEDDDRAALVAAFSPVTADPGMGAIRGQVRKVHADNHLLSDPVPGLAVFAVRLDGGGAPVDTAASDYTDEQGRYGLYHLAPGSYAVRITPLDGSVAGAVPEAINARVAAAAVTNVQPEWYGGPESFSDDPDLIQPVAVSGGSLVTGIDLLTNLDVTPPTVNSTSPANGATDVPIDTPLLLAFSEPVADTTLAKAFKLRKLGNTGTLGGRGQILPPGAEFVFTPTNALEFGTDYEIQITTTLTDRAGVALAAPYSGTFRTETRPTIAITGITPREVIPGAFVTLSGAGFTPGGYNMVLFTETGGAVDTIPGAQVSPTSLVARVPATAVSGPVRVVGTGLEVSNAFGLSILPPSPTAAPAPSGSPIPLGFAPSDVALSPEGTAVFAVGDSGYATISLCTCRPPYRVAVFHELLRGHRAALSPDGRRLFITRPDSGDVVEVVADSSSGQYGQVAAHIRVPGTPDGIVVSASGRRVYASDALLDQVHEIDVDPASLAYRSVVGRRTVPDAVFTGGLALDPQANRLLATTRNLGVIAIDLARDSSWTVLSDQASGGALAATPGGTEVLACPAGEIGSPPLVFAPLPSGAGAGSLPMGGSLRDVAVDPRGQAAYVVNESFSRLQVVDVSSPPDANYHRVIAEAALGANPVAIDRSADGTLMAVANFAESSVSLLEIGSAVGLIRATPPVAAPGDVVALSLSGGAAAVGTRADLGEGDFAILDDASPEAGVSAFVVPGMAQQETHLSLSVPPARRTLALPFRVVDPITNFAPRATGLVTGSTHVACPPDSQDAPLERLLASPDGRLLALFKAGVDPACGEVIDLVDVTADAQGRFQRLLTSVATPFASILDARFASGGKQLWMAIDPALAPEIRVLDTDPASGTFGQLSPGLALGTLPPDARLAADPAGRWMYLASAAAGGVIRIDPDRTPRDTLPASGAGALAASPDGRMLVVARGGLISVFRVGASGFASLGNSAPHAGTIDRLVVSSGGGVVFGSFTNGGIGVWNLDASAGAIGEERSFGFPVPVSRSLGDWAPAPDGHAVISGCATCDSLVRISEGAGTPVVEYAGIAAHSPRLARSVDGRLLWVGPMSEQVRAFALGDASRLSILTGTGLEATHGQPLPHPVTAQVSDATGHPQSGVVVTFALSGPGQGGLGPSNAAEFIAVTDAGGEAACVWTMPDLAGNATLNVRALGVAGGSVAVTARATGDDHFTAPVVVETGPPTGAVGIATSTALFVRFSKAMRLESLASHFVLYDASGRELLKDVHLENDSRTAIVQPSAPLTFASRCSLEVLAGVTDVDGLSLAAPATIIFTVQAQPALSLTALSPPAGPAGASIVLQGVGFSPVASQNTILLNQELLPAQSASPTGLVVRIPPGAQSGDLTVQVGDARSNALHLGVLPPNPAPIKVLESEPARRGIRDLAILPKQNRAYATNPTSNSVTAFQILPAKTLAIIPVGLEPQSIALLPDGSRAYVANRGSDDVSVIDIVPSSSTYHRTTAALPVGSHPTDLAVSPAGPRVVVACAGDSTVRTIDANPNHSTFHQIVTSVKTGSGGTQIVISPDGGTAYIASPNGVDVLDLATNAIVTTVRVGSGGTQVTVSPDGTLLFVLTGDGTLAVVDVSAGSVTRNQIVSTLRVGGGGTNIAVTPDGTALYVSIRDLNLLIGFLIARLNSGQSSTSIPGQAVTLTPRDSVPVGSAPAGVAFDPQGTFGIVANQGSGTLQVLTTLTPTAAVDFDPGAIDLDSPGEVRAYIQPSSPFTADQVVPASVLLNGVLGPDPRADTAIVDHDHDTVPECAVPFGREALSSLLPVGTNIPVTLTGTVGLLPFSATLNVTVRHAGNVASPAGGEEFVAGQSVPIVYTPIAGTLAHAPAVAGPPATASLLGSPDNGRTWSTLLSGEPDDGSIDWMVPGVNADSFRVAVVEVEQDLGGGRVRGVWSVSAPFKVIDVATAALVADFDCAPAADGLLLSWRFASPAEVRAFAIERALAATGPWTELAVTPRDSAGTSRAIDSRVDPGQAYFYRLRLTLSDGRRADFGPIRAIAGDAVREFALALVGPNPGRDGTRLRFDVASESRVRLSIYDVAGREVARLADGNYKAGRFTVQWGGANDTNPVPAGVYFVRYRAGGRTLGRTLVIVR